MFLLRFMVLGLFLCGGMTAFATEGAFGGGDTSGGGASVSWGAEPGEKEQGAHQNEEDDEKKGLVVPTVVADKTVKVTGTVMILDDAAKDYEPAIGASVQMRDRASVGMATGADGVFNLTVDKESDMLRIRYIGYKEKQIPASQCINGCTVKLELAAKELGEVVVTAPAIKTVKVTGTVMILDDAAKDYEPAIGATVRMRDKANVGVTTSADGVFNLTVDKESDVLSVRYIGYQEKQISASQCLTGCTVKLDVESKELGEVVTIGCGNDLVARLKELSEKCAAGNAELATTITTLQKHCDNTERLSDFESVYAKIKDIDPSKCGQIVVVVPNNNNNNKPEDNSAAAQLKVDSIISSVKDMRQGLKSSVWKDKQGNFNTARLISDSVAGVVLGTAGGLITSNVIKKNQIKGGFEDIHCVVGGQVIADYGDEVVVGAR